MKTTIEVNGFEIKIEELKGKIVVSAEKEGEVIEEFELESGDMTEAQPTEGEEMMPFGEEEEDFGQAEEEDDEDFGQAQEEDDEDFGQAQEEDEEDEEDFGQDQEEMEEEEESEGKLESFMSFMKKRKK